MQDMDDLESIVGDSVEYGMPRPDEVAAQTGAEFFPRTPTHGESAKAFQPFDDALDCAIRCFLGYRQRCSSRFPPIRFWRKVRG